MAKDKKMDPVKVAKAISKATGAPLTRVSQIMQKYPLDGSKNAQIIKECQVVAQQHMMATLKKMGIA